MVRLTIEQAIEYLLDKVLDMLDMNVIHEGKAKKMSKDIRALENNPMELKERLEKQSRNKYTLKGSREATNITYAPKETQDKYGKASSLVGSIDNFVGKDNVEYTCGIYCKKVVKKKGKKDSK
tara:strand:- start:171 stop:539 length:369 start_codon:yes stop_codon:yes gene_type:complete